MHAYSSSAHSTIRTRLITHARVHTTTPLVVYLVIFVFNGNTRPERSDLTTTHVTARITRTLVSMHAHTIILTAKEGHITSHHTQTHEPTQQTKFCTRRTRQERRNNEMVKTSARARKNNTRSAFNSKKIKEEMHTTKRLVGCLPYLEYPVQEQPPPPRAPSPMRQRECIPAQQYRAVRDTRYRMTPGTTTNRVNKF